MCICSEPDGSGRLLGTHRADRGRYEGVDCEAPFRVAHDTSRLPEEDCEITHGGQWARAHRIGLTVCAYPNVWQWLLGLIKNPPADPASTIQYRVRFHYLATGNIDNPFRGTCRVNGRIDAIGYFYLVTSRRERSDSEQTVAERDPIDGRSPG